MHICHKNNKFQWAFFLLQTCHESNLLLQKSSKNWSTSSTISTKQPGAPNPSHGPRGPDPIGPMGPIGPWPLGLGHGIPVAKRRCDGTPPEIDAVSTIFLIKQLPGHDVTQVQSTIVRPKKCNPSPIYLFENRLKNQNLSLPWETPTTTTQTDTYLGTLSLNPNK